MRSVTGAVARSFEDTSKSPPIVFVASGTADPASAGEAELICDSEMSINEEKELSRDAEDSLAVSERSFAAICSETSNAKSTSLDAVRGGTGPKGSGSTIVDSAAAIALGVKGSALGY